MLAYGPFAQARAWFQFGEEQVDELEVKEELAAASISPIKPPGRDKEKRMEEEAKVAQSSLASLQASTIAHERAAKAQEVMAASSKAVSQAMAAKAMADGIRVQMEHLAFLKGLDNSDETDAAVQAAKEHLKRSTADYQQLLAKMAQEALANS